MFDNNIYDSISNVNYNKNYIKVNNNNILTRVHHLKCLLCVCLTRA